MLSDISGNIFSSFGNISPTIIYKPQQLFGTGLTIWYDFNDTSTLYTDSAATTNVQNTGDYILYVKNKVTDKPNFDLRQANPSNLPLSTYTASSSVSVVIFNKSVLNTNKNSNILYHAGATNGTNVNLFSISGYSTTGKSALTYSGVFRVVTANTASITTSWQSNIFNVIFTNSNNTSISPNIANTAFSSFPVDIIKSNGYFCCTITVDENKNAIVYLNEYKSQETPITLTYPLLASTNTFRPHFRTGGSFSVRSHLNSGLVEFYFNDSEVLTDDKINKLHQYYRTKYNLPFS